jgi:uncharacterized protein
VALLFSGLVQAQGAADGGVLPVPPLQGRVIDAAGTLSAAQATALSDKLAAIEAAQGSQVVVLIVPTTQPEDIAAYAQRVGDQWKIGRREVGDGLLIVVAVQDRRVRIEVAKALEGAVPDLEARRIITQLVSPAFKAGDYAGGLNRAVDRLGALIKGEALPAPVPGGGGGLEEIDWAAMAMFAFIFVPVMSHVLMSLFGRKLGALATGGGAGGITWLISNSLPIAVAAGVAGLIFALVAGVFGFLRGLASPAPGQRRGHHGPPIIWGSGGGWNSGGGGGWGSGGGFGSGGGGDFGGGGASGDW